MSTGMARRRMFTRVWTGRSVGTRGTHGGGAEQVARENYYMTHFLYCFNKTLISSTSSVISLISFSSWPSFCPCHLSISVLSFRARAGPYLNGLPPNNKYDFLRVFNHLAIRSTNRLSCQVVHVFVQGRLDCFQSDTFSKPHFPYLRYWGPQARKRR